MKYRNDLWHIWLCGRCGWWNTNHAPECENCRVARPEADEHAPAQVVARLRRELAEAERRLADVN